MLTLALEVGSGSGVFYPQLSSPPPRNCSVGHREGLLPHAMKGSNRPVAEAQSCRSWLAPADPRAEWRALGTMARQIWLPRLDPIWRVVPSSLIERSHFAHKLALGRVELGVDVGSGQIE